MLGYYYELLRKKQEEVRRLNTCQSSLSEKQAAFNENEYKCLEPELTATTWYGTLANSFDDIREAGIHTSFLEIAGAQFAAVFSAISDKIALLNAEIESIQRTIADLLEREAEARAKASKQ